MQPLKIISVILAIICFSIALLVAFRTNLLRETNSDTSPYSFSRFQLWLWTLIISPAFVLNWGFVNLSLPQINGTALILLGISAGTLFSANIVTATQKSSKNSPSLKFNLTSKGFWIDILMDDYGQFSVGRLQNLLFTIVYVVVYVSTFFNNGKVYPEFDSYAYLLMGISSGGYLFGKSMYR